MIRIAETIQTDVLVVGAGGAGLRAALEAQAAGATLLVAKGKLGRSTTSFEVAETAGYNAADAVRKRLTGAPLSRYHRCRLRHLRSRTGQNMAEEAPGPRWNRRVGSPLRKKMATIWLWRAVSLQAHAHIGHSVPILGS